MRMKKAFICTLLTATGLVVSFATGQYTLPNGQVCTPEADGEFVPVLITVDGTTIDDDDDEIGSITTIQTVAMVCDHTRPLQVGQFNVPSQITTNIVSVEPGAPFTILSSPPGLATASVSPLRGGGGDDDDGDGDGGTLEFMLGRGMTTDDTRQAGLIIEVPQDHPLTGIEIGGMDDTVQIMGDFPFLSSIAVAGSGTQVQANFTTEAPVMDVSVAGVLSSTKIRMLSSSSSTDVTLDVAGSAVTVEIAASSVTGLNIAGGGNTVLIEGTISPDSEYDAWIAGMFNSLRINDANGGGCSLVQRYGAGNTCTDSTTDDDVVTLEDDIPCTSTAENYVCQVSKTATQEGCWCEWSPEGVVNPLQSPTTTTTTKEKSSSSSVP